MSKTGSKGEKISGYTKGRETNLDVWMVKKGAEGTRRKKGNIMYVPFDECSYSNVIESIRLTAFWTTGIVVPVRDNY